VETGKRFRLMNPTLALDCINGRRVAITVPAGSVIKVVSSNGDEDRLVDVRYGGFVRRRWSTLATL
jgi:hypothetical protein